MQNTNLNFFNKKKIHSSLLQILEASMVLNIMITIPSIGLRNGLQSAQISANRTSFILVIKFKVILFILFRKDMNTTIIGSLCTDAPIPRFLRGGERHYRAIIIGTKRKKIRAGLPCYNKYYFGGVRSGQRSRAFELATTTVQLQVGGGFICKICYFPPLCKFIRPKRRLNLETPNPNSFTYEHCINMLFSKNYFFLI